jgi:acyl carrier protein
LGALTRVKGRDTKPDNLAEGKAATATSPAHTRVTVAPSLSAPSVVQARVPTLSGPLGRGTRINIYSDKFCTIRTIKALKEFIVSLEPESSTVKTSHQEVPPQKLPPAAHDEVKFNPSPHMVSAPAAPPPVIFALPETFAFPTAVRRNSEIERFQEALRIISEESGVAVEDLTDDTEFGDIGVDSLLSLINVGRFRGEISVDLDSNMFLFVQLPTVGAIRLYFESLTAAHREGDTS